MASAQGRPPFRADHVGSLLRPPALRQAFRQNDAKEIERRRIRKLAGSVHPRRGRSSGRCRPAGGHRWRIPARLLLGTFCRAHRRFQIKPASFKFRNDHGHEVEFTAPYARAKIRRGQPLALDEYRFLRSVTKVTGKITLPAPSTMHFYRCNDFADRGLCKR